MASSAGGIALGVKRCRVGAVAGLGLSLSANLGLKWPTNLRSGVRPDPLAPLGAATAAPVKSLLLWGGMGADSVPCLEPAFVTGAPAALPDSEANTGSPGGLTQPPNCSRACRVQLLSPMLGWHPFAGSGPVQGIGQRSRGS